MAKQKVGCMALLVKLFLVIVGGACLVAILPKSDRRRQSEAPLPPPRMDVRVSEVRLESFRSPAGFGTVKIHVDWSNLGNRPVRAVYADLKVTDGDGDAAGDERHNVVYEVKGYPVYAAGNDEPGIAPGGEYRSPPESGHVLPQFLPGPAVHATATITRVEEKGLE